MWLTLFSKVQLPQIQTTSFLEGVCAFAVDFFAFLRPIFCVRTESFLWFCFEKKLCIEPLAGERFVSSFAVPSVAKKVVSSSCTLREGKTSSSGLSVSSNCFRFSWNQSLTLEPAKIQNHVYMIAYIAAVNNFANSANLPAQLIPNYCINTHRLVFAYHVENLD